MSEELIFADSFRFSRVYIVTARALPDGNELFDAIPNDADGNPKFLIINPKHVNLLDRVKVESASAKLVGQVFGLILNDSEEEYTAIRIGDKIVQLSNENVIFTQTEYGVLVSVQTDDLDSKHSLANNEARFLHELLLIEGAIEAEVIFNFKESDIEAGEETINRKLTELGLSCLMEVDIENGVIKIRTFSLFTEIHDFLGIFLDEDKLSRAEKEYFDLVFEPTVPNQHLTLEQLFRIVSGKTPEVEL